MNDVALRLKALLTAIIEELRLDVNEAPCDRCNESGKWQDGADCGVCHGARVIFKVSQRHGSRACCLVDPLRGVIRS